MVATTQPASAPAEGIRVERGVPVAMRDGTVLRADVYRPRAPGRYPVLLERVGYDLANRCAADGELFARHGYVYVGQNTRGAYASEGEQRPFRDDAWG